MTDYDGRSDAAITGAAMKAIRTERRMGRSEVSAAMGLAPSTYDHLEAGRGKITFDRLKRFAAATNCDVIALMACVPLRDPLFAPHCADNKAASILLMAYSELHEKIGADLMFIDIKTMVGAAAKLCRELEEHLAKRDLFAERWIDATTAKITGSPIAGLRRRPLK